MSKKYQNKQNLYEVRIYIRNEHRRYTPWILFLIFILSLISNSLLPFLIYSPLPFLMRKMFSYVLLKSKSPILAASENEIIIKNNKLRLPFKELYLSINSIKEIYFDEILWYSTIGIIMENKSLITLNFSRGIKDQFYESKVYFKSLASKNKISVISGPDSILIKLFIISVTGYLSYVSYKYIR
ncbi:MULTISPECIES: hypothetical protein [Leptospira]|uniref:hypothetical protein n=1 Tax=Leptospira TaxID=171 RepID=UPI000C29EBEE|nr:MULTISPECIES: hypothetical protein [Leptospira]PKA23033.1 hypothetical protein CH381_27895 [Leptospira sp. mixed culture ATI2-C-A1]TGM61986.1 hypothetical protein EHQ93_11705 [Leptospira meyeri]TGM74994.1 hypothetical protein EHQ99_17185 [Leptospira bouyouniensis]